MYPVWDENYIPGIVSLEANNNLTTADTDANNITTGRIDEVQRALPALNDIKGMSMDCKSVNGN
jgi:hypothetical protein